jgi:hypothetical protein
MMGAEACVAHLRTWELARLTLVGHAAALYVPPPLTAGPRGQTDAGTRPRNRKRISAQRMRSHR